MAIDVSAAKSAMPRSSTGLPPAAASTRMLLVPLIGITAAAITFGEPFGLRQVAPMLLTLAGVALAPS